MFRKKYPIFLLCFVLVALGCNCSENPPPQPSETVQVPLSDAYTSLRFHTSDALALLEVAADNPDATKAINEMRSLLEESRSLLKAEEEFAAARKRLDDTIDLSEPLARQIYEGPINDLFDLVNKYYQAPRLAHSTQPTIVRTGYVGVPPTATVAEEYMKLKIAYAKATPLVENFDWSNLRNPDGTVWRDAKEMSTTAWEKVSRSMEILELFVKEETPLEMGYDDRVFHFTVFQTATVHCMLAYRNVWTTQNPSERDNATFHAVMEFFNQSRALAIVIKRRLNKRVAGFKRLPWGYDED